ncbi:MAG: amidase [Sandaracinaceae bacterium]|nr:amidase [Sandaracinaceae bacterium]
MLVRSCINVEVKIHVMSALELKRALRDKTLTSVDVVEALLARRRAVEGKVHAFVVDLGDAAREAAARCDVERREAEKNGTLDRLPPLHGLPITVKENVEIAGTASTIGVEKRRDAIATSDAVTVTLAKRAGAFVIGKTNVPQTLLAIETTNFLFGTTNNPWALDRTPGGSSGGEAAAIASGASVMGIGTDIGGSLRIPAGFSGLATIKPTLHRWSNRGSLGLLLGQEIVRSQIGPIARDAADVAFLLRALDSPLHAQLDPEVPPLPIGDPAAVSLKGLRVGVFEDDGFFTPCVSSKRAVRQAAEALERAGAIVVPFAPPRADEHYLVLACAVTADGLDTLDGWLGQDRVIAPVALNRRLAHTPGQVRRGLSKALGALGERRVAKTLGLVGRRDVASYWKLAYDRMAMQRGELDRWNELSLDCVLCPATATPAAPHGSTADFTPAAAYTTRYNVLNLPAGVVSTTTVRPNETERPERSDRLDKKAAQIQRGSAGLPIGVQIVGRPYREDVVLAVMEHVEREARAAGEAPRTPVDP